MPDITPEDLHAIDIACMVLMEHARRGRKKQRDYIDFDDDPIGAELMEPAVQMVDTARVTLRALLAKHKEVRHVDSANKDEVSGDVR